MTSPDHDYALAQMIHETLLKTWLVRKVGSALGILVGLPMIGAIVAGASGQWGWTALGSILGLLGFVVTLTSATAPMPTQELLDLLDGAGQVD